MSFKCAGCRQNIPNREYLTCALCNDNYDLDCSNVSPQRFYNTMTKEHKKKWKCPSCLCKTPKSDNTDLPIRRRDQDHNQVDTTEQTDLEELSNVTIRKKSSIPYNQSISSSDLSILGETMDNCCSKSPNKEINTMLDAGRNEPLTVDSMNKLLELHFQRNRQSLIAEMRIIMKKEIDEISTDLRKEIQQTAGKINTKQQELEKELDVLKNKIEYLYNEKGKLQLETEKLRREMENYKIPSNEEKTIKENKNSFVLYGLVENCWEPEENTHDRVINAIYEILNIDLSGYIEELTRVGKKGTKRPLKIELISKRMATYILNNGRLFRNTGLAVSPYLEDQSLRERNALRHALLSARKNGHHAVIRNNKLMINGKEFIQPTPQTQPNKPDLKINDKEIQPENSQEDNNRDMQNTSYKKLDSSASQNTNNSFRNSQNTVSKHLEYNAQNSSYRSTLRGEPRP